MGFEFQNYIHRSIFLSNFVEDIRAAICRKSGAEKNNFLSLKLSQLIWHV